MGRKFRQGRTDCEVLPELLWLETKQVLRGFPSEIFPDLTHDYAVPAFRVEDTEGEPLAYQKIELPKLRLMDVAQALMTVER